MTPDGQDVVKTVVLDEAASTSISQIIKTQKYDIEDASFPVDLVFIVDGQSYYMNSQSGQIFGISSVSAVLSEENLSGFFMNQSPCFCEFGRQIFLSL